MQRDQTTFKYRDYRAMIHNGRDVTMSGIAGRSVLIYRAQCARVGKRRGRKNGLSYDRTWLAGESASASLPRG